MYRVLNSFLSMLLDRDLGFVGAYPAFIPQAECPVSIVQTLRLGRHPPQNAYAYVAMPTGSAVPLPFRTFSRCP